MAKTNKEKFKEQVKNAQRVKRNQVKQARKELMKSEGYQITAGQKIDLDPSKSPYGTWKGRSKKYKPSERELLVNETISSDMSVKDLRRYIKQAVTEINKTVNELDVDYRVQQSFDYIGNMYGTYRDKLTTLSKARKSTLLRYARILKSHMEIDDYTSYGREKIEKKTQKAFITYMERNHLHDLTLNEFASVSKMFSKLSSSLIEKYGSTNLIDIWQEQQDTEMWVSPKNFAEIAIDVYKANKGKQLNEEDLAELFREELKKTFDETFKNGG